MKNVGKNINKSKPNSKQNSVSKPKTNQFNADVGEDAKNKLKASEINKNDMIRTS